jgi:hypothetical protein
MNQHYFMQRNLIVCVIIFLLAFAIYWFGIRPVGIRKDCSVVEWTAPATLAIQASANWPQCQKENPFDTINSSDGIYPSRDCHPPKPASPEEKLRRNARDDEYKMCLRKNGI